MKQIIVLPKQTSGATDVLTVAFWYPISSGMQPQSSGSQWTGASAAENSAIQAGTVKEEVEAFSFPVNSAPATMKDVLNKRWAVRNGELNGIGPNQYFGIFFDSVSGWSA
jgi:hypothetical protein